MKKKQNNIGVKRPVDNLGRVTLVKEYRKFLKIEEGDEIEELLVDDTIVIKRVQRRCPLCNCKVNEHNSSQIDNNVICNNCITKMKQEICV